jgi:hypothetical protein
MNSLNTARAPYIKHDSPEVKDVVNFADRFWYILELKIKKLKTIVKNSNNHYDSDMTIIRIQALEWAQGQIQDIILIITFYVYLSNAIVISILWPLLLPICQFY